jgi:hypothetical protein
MGYETMAFAFLTSLRGLTNYLSQDCARRGAAGFSPIPAAPLFAIVVVAVVSHATLAAAVVPPVLFRVLLGGRALSSNN